MIWIVLTIALILRLITINQSLWLDEADNVVAAKMLDFVSFITKYPIGDYHPPGFFILLWVWSRLFGFSEAVVRLPSILLGIGTVFLTYLLGKELFSKNVALLAAFFLASAPLHVYYSQEARMYSLSAFSVAVLSYFLLQLVNNKKWSTVGYTFSSLLVLSSDYVTYLIFPAHLIFLLWIRSKILKKWLLSLSLSFLIFSPWLTVFFQQFLEGKEAALNLPGWKRVAGGADLKNLALVFIKTVFGRISFDNKIVYGGISILMAFFYGVILWLSFRKTDKTIKFLTAWMIIPIVLAVLISPFIPMLSYFRMIFILPAFYLLIARGIFSLPLQFFRLALGVVVLSSLIFLSIYYTNPQFQREDWRGAANFLNQRLNERSVVLFEDNHVKFPYLYYQPNLANSYPGLKRVEAKTDDDVVDLEKILIDKEQVYVFEYLVEITDPQRLLEKKLANLGWKISDVYNFYGVGLIKLLER